jgi:hypothetical protein
MVVHQELTDLDLLDSSIGCSIPLMLRRGSFLKNTNREVPELLRKRTVKNPRREWGQERGIEEDILVGGVVLIQILQTHPSFRHSGRRNQDNHQGTS